MTIPGTPQAPTQLAPDYYLRNFRFLIDHVVDQYADLLSSAEVDFHHKFTQLPPDPQKLYVRMLTRKGTLFRAGKLVYREISRSQQAAGLLEACGLISINPTPQLQTLLPLFSKREWLDALQQTEYREACRDLAKLKRQEFDQYLARLLVNVDVQTLIGEDIYQLAEAGVFDTFRLLFFGNLTQDLTDFVLSDLGLYRYENYRIDKSARLFDSRGQIDRHLEYYLLREIVDDCLAAGSELILELYRLFPQPDAADNILSRRIQKVFLKMARQLERLDCLEQALEIYGKCSLPPARERRVRIYAKQTRFEEALSLCRQILASPFDEDEMLFATRFGQRIARQSNQPWPRSKSYKPATEKLTLPRSDTVEHAVAKHLTKDGSCYYVENGLFCTVFGLLYWEVIFAPVRGAFSHPFQVRPHDLYEREFLDARAEPLAKAQERLENFSEITAYLLTQWQSKYGTLSPFVYWGSLDESVIATAIQHIPALHWQRVFERLWQDPKSNSSGFPDLVFFPADGGYQLIEVKGPGDRLQKNQLRWMHYFAEHNIPHKVIQVEWRE